jgi:acetate kinase
MDTRTRGRRPRGPQLDLAVLSRVLTVNAGSTSLKLSLVDGDERTVPLRAIQNASPEGVSAVGHRVVHGGPRFRQSVVLDDEVTEAIRRLSALAPLHNTPALNAIEDARRALPEIPHVAVFDTAFHATLPPEASTYAIPARWRDEWGVRRYGFHGLAVASVAEQVQVRRLIAAHLGGGCSVTGVLDGRSVETTMGFSPLEGVPMATRSGSVDPGALLYVLREHGVSVEDLDRVLERESGLAALGGLEGALGFAVFTYRVAQAVAGAAVALGGVDALAFSGGVGENRSDVRRAIVERLAFLGNFQVEVVTPREDVVIARAVRGLLSHSLGGNG